MSLTIRFDFNVPMEIALRNFSTLVSHNQELVANKSVDALEWVRGTILLAKKMADMWPSLQIKVNEFQAILLKLETQAQEQENS
jgi:hypothetical protein